MATDKDDEKRITWLSIANLIATFISAIGVILVGLFTVNANNDTQLKLNLLQRESNFALIETRSSCLPNQLNGVCKEILEITNTGQATARKVRIVLAGDAPGVLAYIDDVTSFAIKHTATAIELAIKSIKQSSLIESTQNTSLDSYEIDIDSLPPNNTIQLQVASKPPAFQIYTIDSSAITIHLHAKDNSRFTSNNALAQSVIRKFFADYFLVKKFQISTYCDNCEGVNANGSSNNQINSQKNNDVNSIAFSGLTKLDIQQLTPQSSDNSVWTGSVAATYIRPKIWGNIQPLPTPIVLYAEMNDSSTSISPSGEYQEIVTLCQGSPC